MGRMIFQSALILLVAFPALAGELPTLDQILDRYIEGLGGREAIANLETRTIFGRQIDDRPYAGPPVESKLEIRADAAGNWTMILEQPDGEWREGSCDGDNWVQKPGMVVESAEHLNTKLAFLFNPQGPLMIERYFPNPRVTGTWDYDGIEYYKVENDLKFEYYTLYFEVETGNLSRIGYHWWLEDFEEIDGVMSPTEVVQGRKGGSTNLYFDTVTHGDEVAEYLKPGGK